MAQAQPQSAPGRPRRFGLHFQVVNRIVGQIGRLTAFVVLGLFATTSRSAAQGIEVTVFTGLAYPLYDERLTLRPLLFGEPASAWDRVLEPAFSAYARN